MKRLKLIIADDMLAMRATFLLPMWGEAGAIESVSAFLDTWAGVLLQVV